MPTLVQDLRRFCAARAWQRRILSEDGDEDDRRLNETLQRYVTELSFRLDYISYPYKDDVHRVAELRRILQDLGPVYDGFRERATGMDVLPPLAQSFLDFLNRVSMDAFFTIRRIEAQILSDHKRI